MKQQKTKIQSGIQNNCREQVFRENRFTIYTVRGKNKNKKSIIIKN